MSDPIRKIKGTQLPPILQPPVKHYTLNPMVIEGSVPVAPKPVTFGVSRLWQPQSKDPLTLMIVYDGDIQKYRQHLIAYVSHLIRHYEERGVTPNIGLSAPGFHMQPSAMNAMGKGDLFNALLDLEMKEEAEGLTKALDRASETLRRPQFHENQKSVLLFTQTADPALLFLDSLLLEGDNITLNVVRDWNRDLRQHGTTSPVPWEDVMTDLRSALTHIRPEKREETAANTGEFFLRLGVAQLKYPEKPLLELIDAVQQDWRFGEEKKASRFHARDPFTVAECTLSREGCTLDLSSAAIYFDFLRELNAFPQYTSYVLRDVPLELDVLNLLRYASMPVDTLIDALVQSHDDWANSNEKRVAQKLLDPAGLTSSQKERIRDRIGEMIHKDFTTALYWRLVFDPRPEVQSLDAQFVEYYRPGAETLIFDNLDKLHPDLPVAALRHAINTEGRNFHWEGGWGERFAQLDRETRGRVARELMADVKDEPWRVRLYLRAVHLAKPDDMFLFFPLGRPDPNQSPLELHPVDVILIFRDFLDDGRYDLAFEWVVTVSYDFRYNYEDPTKTAEDPSPLDFYLRGMFEAKLMWEKNDERLKSLAGGIRVFLADSPRNMWDSIAGLWVKDLLRYIPLPPAFYVHLSHDLDWNSDLYHHVQYTYADKQPLSYSAVLQETLQDISQDPTENLYSYRVSMFLPLLDWIDDYVKIADPAILALWAKILAEGIQNREVDAQLRQMMIYRVQRIVQRIGCPEGMRLTYFKGSPEELKVWDASTELIHDKCGK